MIECTSDAASGHAIVEHTPRAAIWIFRAARDSHNEGADHQHTEQTMFYFHFHIYISLSVNGRCLVQPPFLRNRVYSPQFWESCLPRPPPYGSFGAAWYQRPFRHGAPIRWCSSRCLRPTSWAVSTI